MFKKRNLKPAETETKKKGSSGNPYAEHREFQDDRYMNFAVSIHNWQVAFRIVAALLVVSMAFNGYYMMQSKFIPVPIAVDKIGNMVVVGPADKVNPVDSKRVLQGEMIHWIENVRTIMGDLQGQKRFVSEAYARVPSTGSAKTALDEFFKDRKPFARAASETVWVDVKNVNVISANTWQVEWEETTRNLNGALVRQERWKAVVTFEVSPLGTLEGIRANPAGFFITSFNWSKQI